MDSGTFFTSGNILIRSFICAQPIILHLNNDSENPVNICGQLVVEKIEQNKNDDTLGFKFAEKASYIMEGKIQCGSDEKWRTFIAINIPLVERGHYFNFVD